MKEKFKTTFSKMREKLKPLFNKIKEQTKIVFGKIKENEFLRIILELILLVNVFALNTYIGLAILSLILVEIVLSKKSEMSLCIYLFLSFFDEVLIWETIGGSISRIVMAVIGMKLLFTIIKNRILPNKVQIGIAAFLIASFVIGIITMGFNFEAIISLTNVGMFVLFSMCIKYENIEDANKYIEKIFFTIVISVVNSIFYGVLTNSYLVQITDYYTMEKAYRFSGIYEPNFMCMYINLAIMSLIALKENLNKIIYYLLAGLLFAFVIETSSLTGLAAICIVIGIYIIISIRRNGIKLKGIISCVIIATITFVVLLTNKTVNLFLYEYKNKPNDVQVEQNATPELPVEIPEQNATPELPVEIPEQNATPELPVEIPEQNETPELPVEIPEQNETPELPVEIPEQNELPTEEKEIPDNQKISLLQRFEEIKKFIENGELDKISSGRLPLIRTFVKAAFDRPIFNILFGNDITTKKIYCSFFDRECLAHNSFIDFLYNFGVVGCLIIIVYMVGITRKNIFLNMDFSNSKYSTDIKLIRIMLIIFAFCLTLYTKRMFLIFFIL